MNIQILTPLPYKFLGEIIMILFILDAHTSTGARLIEKNQVEF